jgi:hypothetical protein
MPLEAPVMMTRCAAPAALRFLRDADGFIAAGAMEMRIFEARQKKRAACFSLLTVRPDTVGVDRRPPAYCQSDGLADWHDLTDATWPVMLFCGAPLSHELNHVFEHRDHAFDRSRQLAGR